MQSVFTWFSFIPIQLISLYSFLFFVPKAAGDHTLMYTYTFIHIIIFSYLLVPISYYIYQSIHLPTYILCFQQNKGAFWRSNQTLESGGVWFSHMFWYCILPSKKGRDSIYKITSPKKSHIPIGKSSLETFRLEVMSLFLGKVATKDMMRLSVQNKYTVWYKNTSWTDADFVLLSTSREMSKGIQ